MRSNKKRIRIDYAPLNVAVSVSCLTPASPAMQVYNASLPSGEQYEPDRSLSPSQFKPLIYAQASDGSWGKALANAILAQMHWYVNNEEISTLPDWNDLYSIDTTSTDSRGTITIGRNIRPGEKVMLHFEGVIADKRLGINIAVKTDPIILSTEDASEDTYQVSIGDSQAIQYNPFNDKLLVYNYKVAQGIIPESESEESAATDANAHIRRIPVTVYKGSKAMTSGYTLHLYRISGTLLTELFSGDGEVVEIGSDHITLDLRVIEKADYLIKAEIADSKRVEPQIHFSISRHIPPFDCRPTNGTAINVDDEYRLDAAQVSCNNKIVDYPAAIIAIRWCTDTATKERMIHNEGESTKFKIADTGIGNTYEDDWIDVYTEYEIRPTYSNATSEGGDVFVNEKGENLIFN